MSITIKQNILTKSDCYKAGNTIELNSMQLHTIGTAQNTAEALASYWNQPGIKACVQYCIDAEHEGLVYQFLPDNRRPYADAGYGNGHSIAVELMQSDYMKYSGNGASYTITNEEKFKADITRAYNTAVEFFAMKCKEYGWNPQEKMSNGLHRVYSHDEGRRLGLSSAHVDPTHIWNRYGWTMDQFRADVAKAMNGVISPAQIEQIKYKVRMTWDDAKSQLGAYINYDKAVECANENPGYTVFDLSGKALYTSKGLPSVDAVIARQSKANSLALLSTLPDYKGLPDSKQDYLNKVAQIAVKLYPYTRILPSIVISQCCLQNGFGVASDAIQLTKRSNLVGQKADLINSTWQDQTVWDGQKFSKKTPEVYNGVPTTITDWFRIFPNYAYSILDYEMFLTHVKKDATHYKYREVVGMTDPEKMITTIRNNGYATGTTYITSNMRLVNQYDLRKYDKVAISALQNGEDVVIPTVPTSTPASSSTQVEQIQYKVGTAISSSGFVSNQVGAFVYLEKAKEFCNNAGYGYKVFKLSDKSVVYEAPAPSENPVENAVQWALKIAGDSNYGYDQANRWGPNYDCSSFVISAFEQAGIKVKTAGATYTGNMYDAFIKCGFVDVSKKVDMANGSGLMRGDVLLNKVKHTALYIGNGQIVHASRNEKGGATGGASGDQDGKEITTRSYYNSPWDCVLRHSSANSSSDVPYNPPSSSKKTVYRVQVGVFVTTGKRDEIIYKIKKKLNLDCFYEDVDGQFYVYCGSFQKKAKAEERMSILKDNGFDCLIKTVKV